MMKTLDNFASPNNNFQIFRNADPLPVFFENNLIDPSRIVKHFCNDPQANIRVFYYQYLKLCFELENVDFEGYIRKIEELINNDEFKFMFYEEDDPQIFNDLQFKQLIMEFFGVLGQGGIGIQDAINYYPIMDTVFIYFFRALLILTGRTDALDSYIEREQLFQFLCSYFNVEITIHDRCIKFVQSDIFVYQEDPKDVYMAYMEEIDEGEETVEHQQHHENHQQYVQQAFQQDYPNQDQNYQAYQHQEYHQEVQKEEPSYPSYPQQKIEVVSSNIDHIAIAKSEDVTPIHDISYGSSNSQRGTSQINKSYISSEFVDYTQSTSNLQSMVKKDLKQSAEITKQQTFGKIVLESQQQPKQTKASSAIIGQIKPSSKQPVYDSPLNVNISNYDTNKYTNFTQYQNNEIASTNINGSKYNQFTSSKPSSSSYPYHQETPFTKKIEQAPYISKAWEAPPTKDPGFSNKYSPQDITYQTSNIPTKKYTQILEEKYETKKPTSYYTPFEQKSDIKKPASSFQPAKSVTAYNPANYLDNYTSNVSSQASKANSSISIPQQAAYYNPPVISNYKPPTPLQPPIPQQYPAYNANTGKNPFNLNVSLEFTNSFTMKVMAQPFKSNVKVIRSRARDFRNSLLSYIK